MGMIFLRNKVSGAVADAYAIGGASPELVAAFLTAADGTTEGEYFRTGGVTDDFSMFTFSRSGTATYFDSNGTLQTAADGVARRNAYYYDSGWVKGGLQLESAAATNQAPYSNDFSQWVAQGAGATITASASNGPLGASTMSKFAADGGSTQHYIRDLFSIATGNNTFAYWVKSAGEGVHPQIRATGEGGGFAYVNFDIDNGIVGNSGGSNFVDADIVDYGGGVYLIFGVINHTASGDGALLAMCENPATDGELPVFDNDGAGFYVSGAQVEAGSVPTSYIPTNGSTVTRAAETLSIAGADTPANTTAMSISMKGLMTYADEGAAAQETFLRWYTDANNFITLDLDTDSTATGEVNANQSAAGTLDTVVAGAEYSPGVNVAFNIASRHTSGAINVAKDGTAATADTTPTALADLSSTALTPGYGFNGFISELRLWGADIGDSGIEEVTA